MSRSLYNKMRQAFQRQLKLDSEYLLYRRMDHLSGVQPTIIDCCNGSCVAYTTPELVDATCCPFCQEPRFDSAGKARAHYWYLPITKRLQGMFENNLYASSLQYQLRFRSDKDLITDVFDSEHYKKLKRTRVTVDGKTLKHRFFEFDDNMALGVSMDGVSLFVRRKNACTATPIVIVNYNLKPSIRTHSSNVLLSGIIPGPKSPKDVRSFMWPLVLESHVLARGVKIYHILRDETFLLRAYFIRHFGDMIAMIAMM